MAALAAGFIGLGAMGGAMATRLLDSGVALHVLDVDTAAMAPFLGRGAVGCATPAEMAERVDVVFSCLPDAATASRVAADLARGCRLRVLVETGTIGKQAIEPIAAYLAAHGKDLVDMPASGGPRGARQGTLSAMVAGPPAAVALARPLIGIVARHVFVVGEAPGLAQIMKLVNNLISAANMAGAFEALVFGARAGLDPALMVDVVNASTGRNSATTDKIPKGVLTGTFDYGARTDIFHKDVTLGLAEAEALGVPVETLVAASRIWRAAMARGEAAEDYTSVVRDIEAQGGAELRSRKLPLPR